MGGGGGGEGGFQASGVADGADVGKGVRRVPRGAAPRKSRSHRRGIAGGWRWGVLRRWCGPPRRGAARDGCTTGRPRARGGDAPLRRTGCGVRSPRCSLVRRAAAPRWVVACWRRGDDWRGRWRAAGGRATAAVEAWRRCATPLPARLFPIAVAGGAAARGGWGWWTRTGGGAAGEQSCRCAGAVIVAAVGVAAAACGARGVGGPSRRLPTCTMLRHPRRRHRRRVGTVGEWMGGCGRLVGRRCSAGVRGVAVTLGSAWPTPHPTRRGSARRHGQH